MADCKRKTANLFSDKLIGMTWWDGVITADERFTLYIAEVKPNTEYTASGNNSVDNTVVTYYSVYPAEGQSSVESVRYVYPTNPTRSVATFTTPDDSRIKYAAVRFGSDATEVMFNLGSTAFPYEPNGWVHSLRKLSTATDTITTLPAVIYPNDTTATVGLKGQAVQSSTPSPTSPVMPQETGERTGNLFDKTNETIGKYMLSDGTIASAQSYSLTDYIPIIEESSYTISAVTNQSSAAYHCFYTEDKVFISSINCEATPRTFTTPANAKYIRCSYRIVSNPNIMLNTGSTPLPYEPYGYKLDISSASTTTPIYLGEVESTRRIKKLVLTGEEAFTKNNGQSTNYLYYANRGIIIPGSIGKTPVLCNELPVKDSAPQTDIGMNTNNNFSVVYFNFGEDVMNAQPSGNTVAGLKEYLAQQYAAGAPVTVWYVLATPETAVVNEPIRKIGEYADEVSGISIPVTAGGDTISVDTTLQPSEVTVNYKGWHPVQSVHERENGQWD